MEAPTERRSETGDREELLLADCDRFLTAGPFPDRGQQAKPAPRVASAEPGTPTMARSLRVADGVYGGLEVTHGAESRSGRASSPHR
jgi:hypothetical protein